MRLLFHFQIKVLAILTQCPLKKMGKAKQDLMGYKGPREGSYIW